MLVAQAVAGLIGCYGVLDVDSFLALHLRRALQFVSQHLPLFSFRLFFCPTLVLSSLSGVARHAMLFFDWIWTVSLTDGSFC